jgi:deoxyribodipyrimidine photo-lyase
MNTQKVSNIASVILKGSNLFESFCIWISVGIIVLHNTNMTNWGIHWFRRDLRIAGNSALQWSWKRNQGKVVGLFCFDSKFLSRSDFSHNRFAFFLETLFKLKDELLLAGSDLWVVDSQPQEAFPKIRADLKEMGASSFCSVSFNRDYEPFARKRDKNVTALLQEVLGVEVHTDRDHLLLEPWEVLKSEGESSNFYQIYSPYAKKWFEKLKSGEISRRLNEQKAGLRYLDQGLGHPSEEKIFSLKWRDIWKNQKPSYEDSLELFKTNNQKKVTVDLPLSGSFNAYRKLNDFKGKLDPYGEKRDFPGIEGTSKLSIYFKNGSLTVSQVIAVLGLNHLEYKSDAGATKYLKELVWREFYYSILYNKPEVESNSFLEKYKELKWENNEELFEAWKQGLTGFPIVDAGMRQLKQEGWMHNRVRMIVASFLTKDLLIDWRWGENHFMKELLDGDLAPNNGGWQWAASTGCDPQPYFRIFNPELQSLKFDPNGDYIGKYVPELAGLNPQQLHAPHKLGPGFLKKIKYPAPIVDHAQRKLKAVELFKGGVKNPHPNRP